MKLRSLWLAVALVVGAAGIAEAQCPNVLTLNLATDKNGNGCVVQADLRGTLTIQAATLNSIQSVTLDGGRGSGAWQIAGLTASGATLTPVFTDDGSTWQTATVISGGVRVSTLTADGSVAFDAAHHAAVGLKVTVVGTGTISAVYDASVNAMDPLLRAELSVTGSAMPGSDTPPVQNAAYAQGNCIGGFRSVALAATAGGGVELAAITLKSVGGVTSPITIYVFDSNPSASTCTDRSTFTLNAADVSRWQYTNSLTPSAPVGTSSTMARQTISPPAIMNAGGSTGSGVQTIWYALVAGAALTPASTIDIQVRLEALH